MSEAIDTSAKSPAPQGGAFRPRLSLLSLLLLVAIVSLALALWRERQATHRLHERIASLRSEVGEVTVADRTKLTVQPLSDWADAWNHFRWRAYTPPGSFGRVVALIASDQRPGRRRRVVLPLEPGEMNFDFSVSQHPTGQSWMYSLRRPLHRGGGVAGPAPPWFGTGFSSGEVVDRAGPPQALSPGERKTLIEFAGANKDGHQVAVELFVELLLKHEPRPNATTGGELIDSRPLTSQSPLPSDASLEELSE